MSKNINSVGLKIRTTTAAVAAPINDESALLAEKKGLKRLAAAAHYLDVSLAGLYRLSANDPTFPRKIVLGRRCVGFRTDSLDAWLAAKEQSL